MRRSWDIFCSVVDNFGDVGVCWRLARQLAGEQRQAVRLWVDDAASLARLNHAIDPALASQRVAGVEIRRWDSTGHARWAGVGLPDICIEGFGVRLPPDYIKAMAQAVTKPVWLNLEYLSAESWVESHHALPSVQPDSLLTKYFFFPGFSEKTGGLIVERDLHAQRNAFQSDDVAQAAFRQSLGLPADGQDGPALWVSLFCYENKALPGLLDAWAGSGERVVCVVTDGLAAEQVSRIVGRTLHAGDSAGLEQGRVTLHVIPFLEQDNYDRLLWSCDLNFVRGEDSFVRAQLAGRPLVWQAYPQREDAHLDKLSAFLQIYTVGMDTTARRAAHDLTGAWNHQTAELGAAWSAWRQQASVLTQRAQLWSDTLLHGPNLAERLAQFCENQLK